MKEQLNYLYSNYQKEYIHYKKKSKYCVMLRTFILLCYLSLIAAGIKLPIIKPYFLTLFIMLTIVFIIVCYYHNQIKLQEDKNKISQEIIEEYYQRINNEWSDFNDLGLDLVDQDKHFLFDLDIVGKNSLYQYLNIAKSQGGRKKLIERLSAPQISITQLKNDQDAIEELTDNLVFCIEFQVMLRKIKGDLTKQCESFHEKTNTHKAIFIMNLLFSFVTLSLGLLSLFSIVHSSYFTMAAILQLSYSLIIDKLYHKELYLIKKVSSDFGNLYPMFHLFQQYSFKSIKLNELKKQIQNGENILLQLNKINDLNSFRNQFLGYVIANSLFPLNTYLLYSFHKLQQQSKNELKDSIQCFELIETFISLSVIGVCKENICMPILNNDMKISFTDIKHPLINEQDCVVNSFQSQNSIHIITGSNMSGKTSFMRTIGMNLILMYAGTYVNSIEFKAPYMKIFTSMRVQDDIEKGISTFYGELLRIKEIIEGLKQKTPFIVFIDEIFKGTNYNDRIYGAKQVISKLNQDYSIVFITTHDFELCDINNISNYYFEEHYENEKIKFDYKIKKGQCKTTNAKFLMKQLNII